MDVLRKELNAFYESQNLCFEKLDDSILAKCRKEIEIAVEVDSDCRVITDASADRCYILGGMFPYLIGVSDKYQCNKEADSSDEDEIYSRIHPEDLVDKRMLEYEFFKFIDTLPSGMKSDFRATCRLRMKDRYGNYLYADNLTRILRLSPAGKVWLILCCYNLSPNQNQEYGISPRVIDCKRGTVEQIHISDKRGSILTEREKEILKLIKDGMLSKQIACRLGISVNTVNRHRQNILEKLSVGNSVEAVTAASMMKLL